MEQLVIINLEEPKHISLIVLLKDSNEIIKIDEILVYKKALNFKNTYEYTIAGLSIDGTEKKFEHYILEQKDIDLIELSIR